MQHPDSELVVRLASFVIGLGNVYIFCYFGKVATESFNNSADSIYDSKWQCLDVDLQKYLLLMIRISQRQLYYHGHGMLILNLETFTQVTNPYIQI